MRRRAVVLVLVGVALVALGGLAYWGLPRWLQARRDASLVARTPLPDLLQQAQDLLYHNDQGVVRLTTAILVKYPDNAEVLTLRGVAHHNLGERDSALADLDQAAALRPDYGRAALGRGLLKNEMRRPSEAVQDLRLAVDLLTRELQASPPDAKLYLRRATALLALKQYDQALADTDRALEITPQKADAYEARADILRARGDYRQALEASNRALEVDAQAWHAWYGHAVALYDLGEVRQSLPELNHALEINPGYIDGQIVRASICGREGCRSVSKNDPVNGKVWLQGAVRYCDEALKLAPHHPVAWGQRAIAWYDLHDAQRAAAAASQALKYDPENADAYFIRGASYGHLTLFSQGREDLEHAIRLDPGGPAGKDAVHALAGLNDYEEQWNQYWSRTGNWASGQVQRAMGGH